MSAWPRLPLGDLLDDVITWVPERDNLAGTFTYIDLSAVDQELKIVSGARVIPTSDAPSRARQLVQAGDVLVSTVRPNLNAVAEVPLSLDGATASTGFCVLRPRPGKLDTRYLYNWVRTPDFISNMTRRATGANYPAVSDRIVFESALPLPPFSEQRRIAAILDKADDLRAKRRTAIAQLDSLTQSTFLDMFGDPQANPLGWSLSPLGDLGQIGTGSTPSRRDPEHFGGSIPWVKTTEVNWDVIRSTEEHLTETGLRSSRCRIFPKGSVVVALYGQGKTRGQAAVLGIDAATNQACGVLQLGRKVRADFLLHHLRLSYSVLRGLSRGGNQENLNLGLLTGFHVMVPPLELQSMFADRLHHVTSIRSQCLDGLRNLESLFSSLQRRAFCGEL